MKNVKIKKGDYEDLEYVNIEIKDGDKNYVANVFNVKKTIESLKEKKKTFNDQIDEEIAYNQDILDTIKTDLKKVKIKKREPKPFIPLEERDYSQPIEE